MLDNRYTVTKEYCGQPKPQWVARFCGDWIGRDESKPGAWLQCQAHDDARKQEMGIDDAKTLPRTR